MKLEATEKQLDNIRNMMLRRLDGIFGDDTVMYEKIRIVSNKELEYIFKEQFGIKSEDYYFD